MPGWMKWLISLLIGLGIVALGWYKFPFVLNTFFVLICFVLIIVVLLQSGSAADLPGAFRRAGSQPAFNPPGPAPILSQPTPFFPLLFMLPPTPLVPPPPP